MNFASLFDLSAAAIVVGGTGLATLLRCGFAGCGQALAGIVQFGPSGRSRRFDAKRARAEMAVQIQEIRQVGLIGAQPHHIGDREFDEATDAMISQRSVPALLAAHQAHHLRRVKAADKASSTLAQASELAPVFGLAGTLISLSQLPAEGIARGSFTGAISLAVLTTLYGLLLANLLLAPLARMVERAAAEEEAERETIMAWLASQIEATLPPRRGPRLVEAS